MNDFKKDRAMLDHEGQATGGQSQTLPVEFKFEEHTVRTVHVDDEIRFVATDVCEALGIKDASDAVARLDQDEKGAVKIPTLGGPQEMNVVN